MRQFALILGIVLVGVALLRSTESAAVRAPCFTGDERLLLTPSGAVTVDGFIAQRSSTTGHYQADGGIDFEIDGGSVSAVLVAGTCGQPAPKIRLSLIDPFSGVPFEAEAVLP
jgi:hypothetical protein